MGGTTELEETEFLQYSWSAEVLRAAMVLPAFPQFAAATSACAQRLSPGRPEYPQGGVRS